MLAEPIVIGDGDSFLQEPIHVQVADLPELPPLTWTRMAGLRARLQRILVQEPDLSEPVRIELPGLPPLPALDRAQMAQLQMSLECVLKDP